MIDCKMNCSAVALQRKLSVEVVVDNLGFGGSDEGAKRFEICLTDLLNRFKAI